MKDQERIEHITEALIDTYHPLIKEIHNATFRALSNIGHDALTEKIFLNIIMGSLKENK